MMLVAQCEKPSGDLASGRRRRPGILRSRREGVWLSPQRGQTVSGEFSMSGFSPIAFIPAEPSVVATDIPCRKCRYNLRGLNSDSRCPECGAPVGLSLRGDLMRYSDPAWVETLRQGVSLILWSVVIAIFAAVISALTAKGGQSVLGALATLAGGVLQIIGAWMLTTPDPSGLGEDRYGTSRKIIRFTLIVGLMQQLLAIAIQSNALPPDLHMLVLIISGIAGLIGLVGTFATLKYLASLAMRIPSESLARRATTLMWGISISFGVLIIVGAIMGVVVNGAMRGGGAANPFMGILCVGGICGVALLVFGVMYLFMLGRFAKELRVQADYARSTWASTPANPAQPSM
jgi:hypothetical protein